MEQQCEYEEVKCLCITGKDGLSIRQSPCV